MVPCCVSVKTRCRGDRSKSEVWPTLANQVILTALLAPAPVRRHEQHLSGDPDSSDPSDFCVAVAVADADV